jgi:hypothetical protein
MGERRLTWVIILACAAGLSGCSGEHSDSFAWDAGGDGADGDTDGDGADGGVMMDAGEQAPREDAGPVGCVAPTMGPTMHVGDVMDMETWTADGSPHVVTGNVNVRSGATLIIEPCAVVQFAAGANLNVAYPLTPNQGALVAEGTASQPIRFESLAADRWGHLFVQAPGSASLAYVTLSGGGGEGSSVGETVLGTGDGELPSDGVLALDHVTIQGSAGPGLKLTRDARLTEPSRSLVVQGSGNEAHPYPVELGELAINTLPDGSYTGNTVDEILITTEIASSRGGILENTTMHDRGVPYHVGESDGIDHLRVGAPEGEPAVTLTIEPGVTLKFLPNTALTVEFATGEFPASGILEAEGTAEKPIVFTSAKPTPAAGDWRGLWYGGIASDQNRLDHVVIEYSGADCSCVLVTCNADVTEYEGAIIFTQPPPGVFMSNSIIRHGSGHGVVLGYDGDAYDFRASNSFEDLAGCIQTLPRSTDTSCPDPEPLCVR